MALASVLVTLAMPCDWSVSTLAYRLAPRRPSHTSTSEDNADLVSPATTPQCHAMWLNCLLCWCRGPLPHGHRIPLTSKSIADLVFLTTPALSCLVAGVFLMLAYRLSRRRPSHSCHLQGIVELVSPEAPTHWLAVWLTFFHFWSTGSLPGGGQMLVTRLFICSHGSV
jgi:hypothetical protein